MTQMKENSEKENIEKNSEGEVSEKMNPEKKSWQENLSRVHNERTSKLFIEYDAEAQMLKREKDEEVEEAMRRYEENMERLNQWREATVSYIVARNREERRAPRNPTGLETTLDTAPPFKTHPTCHLLQAPCALHKKICIPNQNVTDVGHSTRVGDLNLCM